MGQSVAPASGQGGDFKEGASSLPYFSKDLSQMKNELMQECKYLISDPNQLYGMVQALAPFSKFGDDHFKKAYEALSLLVKSYAEKKEEDPAHKINPLEKGQIQSAAEVLFNLQISLSPEEFKEGIEGVMQFVLEELGSEKKTVQLLARLTGTISLLCALPCFARDPTMNDLFFDLSTYTMGNVAAISIPQITESIDKILSQLK